MISKWLSFIVKHYSSVPLIEGWMKPIGLEMTDAIINWIRKQTDKFSKHYLQIVQLLDVTLSKAGGR